MSILELHGACDHTLCALMSRYAVFLTETCPKLMDTKIAFYYFDKTDGTGYTFLSRVSACMCVCDFGDK